MLRLTAERRETLGRESGAHASHKTPPAATADKAVSYSTPNGALRNLSASRTRPESQRDTLPDLTVWIVWTALTAAGLLALCALVWIVAGVPS